MFFQQHFDSFFLSKKSLNEKSNTANKNSSLEKNPFYSLKYLEYITNYMYVLPSIPTNNCSFKDRGQPEFILKNWCTIDDFLFSLWVTCQIDQKFLAARKVGLYENLAQIINFINIGALAKAKHHWVVNCLKMDSILIDKKYVVDCFGNLMFIDTMSLLQKFKIKKLNCKDSNNSISEYSFVSLTNKLQLKKNLCTKKCGDCSWDEIIFESVPLWFVRELNEEIKTISSLIEEFKELVLGDDVKFKLSCIYDFIKNTENENLNHFKGIFYLNSKFFLVDNLLSDEMFELKPDYLVHATCIIYYKV